MFRVDARASLERPPETEMYDSLFQEVTARWSIMTGASLPPAKWMWKPAQGVVKFLHIASPRCTRPVFSLTSRCSPDLLDLYRQHGLCIDCIEVEGLDPGHPPSPSSSWTTHLDRFIHKDPCPVLKQLEFDSSSWCSRSRARDPSATPKQSHYQGNNVL
jgi:hypothetical protein